jgi:hypothetical protein
VCRGSNNSRSGVSGATLVGSQLVGLAMARYVLRIEPLASADPATVAAWIAPTLERYLTA